MLKILAWPVLHRQFNVKYCWLFFFSTIKEFTMLKSSLWLAAGLSLVASVAFAVPNQPNQMPPDQQPPGSSPSQPMPNGSMAPQQPGMPVKPNMMLMIKKWHKRISWMKPIVVKEDNPVVTVKLPATPSTGFTWILKRYNSDLVKPVSAKYVPPLKQIAGAPGHMEWKFKLDEDAFVVPQMVKVVLVYARPWTRQGKTMKVVTFITQPK
jgi:predicted secreted protein